MMQFLRVQVLGEAADNTRGGGGGVVGEKGQKQNEGGTGNPESFREEKKKSRGQAFTQVTARQTTSQARNCGVP